jgi:flagellar motor protein MotB
MKAHVVNRMVLAMALAGVSFLGLSAATYAQPRTQPQQEDVQEEESPKHKKSRKAQGQEEQNQEKAQQRQQDKQEKAQAQQQQQKRLSEQQQRRRIEEQQQRLTQYREHLDQQQRLAEQYAERLKQQNRMEHYQFQEQYLQRLREQQHRIQNARDYDYDADPYFYTPPIYRYSRGGRYYETNQYGADLLREAVNNGYEEGFRAGRADRQDRWRSSYKDSYAYRDANYGYSGYYVPRDDYNHYFREGFRRGYEDGYDSRYQYGSYEDGRYSVLQTVLSLILELQPLR